MSRALLVAVLAVLTIGAGRSGDVQGSVIYVVDGDTIHVRIDNHVEKVRYLGIDAPEVPHPRGDAHRGHDRRRPRFFPNTPAAGDAARRVNIELVSGNPGPAFCRPSIFPRRCGQLADLACITFELAR